MPEYLAPGVYVEEIERGPRPIEGVPTSTAAFLGETERGPTASSLRTSYGDYMRWFGNVFLPDRVHASRRSRVFRKRRQTAVRRADRRRAINAGIAGSRRLHRSSRRPGAWGTACVAPDRCTSTTQGRRRAIQHGFRLQLAYWSVDCRRLSSIRSSISTTLPRPQHQEDFDDLSVDPLSSTYFSSGSRCGDQPIGFGARQPRIDGEGAVPTLPAPTHGDLLDVDGATDPNSAGRRRLRRRNQRWTAGAPGHSSTRARPLPRRRARLRAVSVERAEQHRKAARHPLRAAALPVRGDR